MTGASIASHLAMRAYQFFGVPVFVGLPSSVAAVASGVDWRADAADRAEAAERLRRVAVSADRITRRHAAVDQADALIPAPVGPLLGHARPCH